MYHSKGNVTICCILCHENNSQTNYTERAKLRIERLKNEKLLSQNQYEEQKKVILDGGSVIIEEVIDRLKKNKKDTRI